MLQRSAIAFTTADNELLLTSHLIHSIFTLYNAITSLRYVVAHLIVAWKVPHGVVTVV